MNDGLEKSEDMSLDAVGGLSRCAHWVDGHLYRDKTEKVMCVARPSDRKRLGDVPIAGRKTVDYAVQNAKESVKKSGWAHGSPRERAKVLRNWATLLEENSEELAKLESIGSTRPIREVVEHDIPFTAEGIRYFSEWTDKLGGEVAATSGDRFGFVHSQPYGVIGAISAWNFPLMMASWKCGAALAAGNAVVLKPSELTPFSALRFAELAIEAGMPPGVLNIVNGDGPRTGQYIIEHPGIGKVSFTGSRETGAKIMVAAAQNGPKPVTLELGGQSPQLVYEDVTDLDYVADCVAKGVLANGGQGCVAGSRLIAHKAVCEPIVERVMEKMDARKAGYTWDMDTTLAPIVSEGQMLRLESLVAKTCEAGGRAIVGGGRIRSVYGDAFYQPTILSNVAPGMACWDNEIFGPVLCVKEFSDDDEGVELAQHKDYGLAAGVHTSDIGRALRTVRALGAGTIWVNRYGRSYDFGLPTGGFGGSGFGKDLGREAVQESLQYKSTLIAI